MSPPQALSFALLAAAIALFAWGRIRYDTIALTMLLIAVLSGDVKPKEAFSGFSSDVVVIIAAALVVSAAIGRSGVIEPLIRPLTAKLRRPASQVPVLAGATALFAMMTKNVGALATLMPVANRLGRRPNSSTSALLMPMSFMALLGGLVTLVGTSTNIIASQVRQDMLGRPFRMFDFTPVGLSLTVLGLVFVSFGWRLLPRHRQPRPNLGELTADTAYVTEARIPEGWPGDLPTLDALDLSAQGVHVAGLIGDDGKPRTPLPDAPLTPGMTLLLEGDEAALAALFQRSPLEHVRERDRVPTGGTRGERVGIEAVVERHSPLIERSPGEIGLLKRHGIKLLAVSRRGARIASRLTETRLHPGDLLLLQAGEGTFAGGLRELGLLPLAERKVTMGDSRRRYLPLAILAAAIVLVALQVLPVAIGFFAAAVLIVLTGSLTMREAYASLDGEVLILIGALTPLSEAVQHSGGAALLGHALAASLYGYKPILILGGLLVTAMACSPFLHNAPTVLVLAPLAVTLAQKLGLNPDPFLMAVATGAGCDFLTPIGHQCNTLVRGPGGYRFGDYARLGLPLSVVVILCGTPLIAYFWPLGR
ncbi:MAG: SLC13 family permease [Novosphingobium sp.]|nr:SLC13 family permease [Novosphingobium sp.]